MIVIDFIMMGVTGQSSRVGTLEMLCMTAYEAWRCKRKTGCGLDARNGKDACISIIAVQFSTV